MDESTDADRLALAALRAAVYPPEVLATSPGRSITWAPPQWNILGWDDDGRLLSQVGILTRRALLDGTPVEIGGIASVKTHPRARGRGYATAGLRRAAAFLGDRDVAFSLLVCGDHLLPFYGGLGWYRFEGDLVVAQPAGTMVFTVNRTMVRAGTMAPPAAGTIDLNGLPW
jgi:GNAT superfamily N-acetyltransferase